MTPEIAMYVLGAALIPAVGWSITIHNTMSAMSRDIAELRNLHRNPSESGLFNATNESIARMNAETVKLFVEQTGRTNQVMANTVDAMHKLRASIDAQTAYFRGRDDGFVRQGTDHG